MTNTKPTKTTLRTIGLFLGYLVNLWAIRLIFLTIVTYTLIHTPDQATVAGNSLQKIGDIARANQILTYGFSAFAFIFLLHALQPLTRTKWTDIISFDALKKAAPQQILAGIILTATLILGTALGGHLNFLGIYLRFDEVMLSIGSAIVFSCAIFAMTLVEEFILRTSIEAPSQDNLQRTLTPQILRTIRSCIFFIIIKYSEFDFSLSERAWLIFINFILLNIVFSTVAKNAKPALGSHSHLASAIFASSFFILLHVFFGLPFMGQDMPGIFLLRAATDTNTATVSADSGLGALLSGGTDGPESGLVLTVLLFIYLYLPKIRAKKN